MKRRDLWYKDAIIYCLDVETFKDSNGDGVGDFNGLISKLDFLASLGVNCIWLLPFYPTPNRDNGYDVMDYYSVDERLGTLGHFVEFAEQAKQHGMRIIIDLVINHTSIEHPWFQKARKDPDSPYRDYYVWSEEKPEDADEGMIFPGHQEAVWTYDDEAQAYYFHRFYKHQPDLNMANPAVREEIRLIMGFWLALGVSGFRIDAAPFVVEMRGIDKHEQDQINYFEDFRQFLSWRRGDAILLAEANIDMDKVPYYFGDGDRMHMLFHFMANQHLFLALARGKAAPLKEGLSAPPDISQVGQWAHFLRNHDEIDLGRLGDAKQEAFEAFGPEENMQIYERGIRRRLAPMLNGDRRCIELAYSLMFTLPGTPVLRYGQEIGMGDDLSLPERNSIRTPMQWNTERNAGFSTAAHEDLIRPVIDEGEYSYKKVNFADQQRNPDSLLNWMGKVIRTRKECPEFGYGEYEVIDVDEPSVFVHRCHWQNGLVYALHNLADKDVTVRVDFGEDINGVIDLLGNRLYEAGKEEIDLDGYGYRWFRIKIEDV